jgi:zinc protease
MNTTPDGAPPAYDFLETSGGITAWQLRSNGLRVLVMPDATAPVVAFMVTYGVGSRNEGPGLTGATHFLEHLMFKGSARFNKAQGTSVFNTLQRVGAQLNATTWLDRTNYYELLPKAHLSLAVEIEADRMRQVLLDPADVESERTVILNEFDRGENEAFRKLYQAVWQAAFVAHPYRHPTIGWRSDIAHLSPESLRHFYDTYYWPNNATISILGDVVLADALDLVARHFGSIPAAPHPIPPVHTQEPVQRGERRTVVRLAGQLGTVMVAWKAPDAHHADTDALDVLAMVLASGKTSRCYRALTDQGLATSVGADVTRLRDPGLFYAWALLAPNRTHAEAEAALLAAVEAVRQDGIAGAELDRARNQLRAQFAFGQDGPYAIAAQLNEAIASGDWKHYTTYLDRLAAVTAADVQRVAQDWLVEDRRTVGWYVPG